MTPTASTAPRDGAGVSPDVPPEEASPGDAPSEDAATGHVASTAGRSRANLRRWAVDAAVLFGLAGVAITQPLLDLLGNNPTFFVAGHYTGAQIVSFGLLVALVPGTVVVLTTKLAGLAGRRPARVAHGIGVALLAGLFGMVLCRTWRVDGVVYVVAVTSALGVVVAALERRSSLARQFLALLAVGNLAFVALFLTASPTAELLVSHGVDGELGQVTVPELSGPVVVLVLDELPVTAIMRGDGTINDTRYPNLARLAAASTWFRNASSESPQTFVSVPDILSGVRADDDDLPIVEHHPRNYFSLFGDRYPVHRYELVTDMCPPDVCDPAPAQPLGRLVDDAAVVYQHRVLPPALHDRLPAIDEGWGSFGASVGGGSTSSSGQAPSTTVEVKPLDKYKAKPSSELGVTGQAALFRHHIGLIDAEPSVNFIHVKLPHHPYWLTPWGEGTLPEAYTPDGAHIDPLEMPPVDDPSHDFRFRQVYPLLAMQLGAVDSLLGEMIDRLESTGAWDDALLVVMSDHGVDMTPPGWSREEDPSNTDELHRIPLFVKAPGQTEGVVSDVRASTVDVLPSIVDLLDIETDWEFEGHSLFDGSEPSIETHVQSDVDAAFQLAAAHEAQFPRGEDWVALAAVGEGEDLVGQPVSDHRVGDASDMRWTLDAADLLGDLSLATDQVPYLMGGTVIGDDAYPPELVVAVNGTLAGTVGGYQAEGDRWRFTGVVAPFFVDGANQVEAYEVERGSAGVVLHPVGTG